MKYLTLKRLLSWGPCYTEKKILEMSRGRRRIKVDNIFDLDISDAEKLWILLHEPIFTARELRLMACDFAEDVLHYWYAVYPDDHRPRECIDAARLFAKGRDAAWDAGATAEAAAGAAEAAWAAWATAGDAGRAAGAAAGAAWDARATAEDAGGAAWDAARDAGRAAGDAAGAAWDARAAAGNAARAAQLKIVKKYWRQNEVNNFQY